nr:zinc finger, CCHC-type [Tanacetum cinerariifolium]
MNTIELPVGNNVVPLRSDTIRLVQNECSFHGIWSEDPNQQLKDFLKLVDSLDLDGANRERMRMCLFQFSLRDQASNWLERLPVGSITTWDDLTTRFLAHFFPPRRTAKLRNDILIDPEKVLIREEAKFPVTKNVKSISLTRGEEEGSDKTDVTTDNETEKSTDTGTEVPAKEAEKEDEAENEPNRKVEREETTEAPSSQPVIYYLKHRISERLIEGLVGNHRFNDSISGA